MSYAPEEPAWEAAVFIGAPASRYSLPRRARDPMSAAPAAGLWVTC